MVVTIFRLRMKPGVDVKEYTARVSDLLAQAQKTPGFVSIKSYASGDGEHLALVEFETEQALTWWRRHPDHLIAKELGRSTYFSEYRVQICKVAREYRFKALES